MDDISEQFAEILVLHTNSAQGLGIVFSFSLLLDLFQDDCKRSAKSSANTWKKSGELKIEKNIYEVQKNSISLYLYKYTKKVKIDPILECFICLF